MPRRPAVITQADVARAIRAAQQTGAAGVEIHPDGTIFIRTKESGSPKLAGNGEPAENDIDETEPSIL